MQKVNFNICKICGQVIKKGSPHALSAHLTWNHKTSFKEYYDTFYLLKNENICKYPGCSNEAQFYKRTYRHFCLDHAKKYDEPWFIGKYGEEEGKIEFNKYKTKVKGVHIGLSTLDGFIKRYGIEEGTKKYNLFILKCSTSLTGFIERYGIEEGTRKYNLYIERLSENRKGRGTLDWHIEKYGEEEGTEIYNEKGKKRSISRKGVLSLDWYIEKYGEEEGTEIYNERGRKSSESKKGTKTKKWYIEKYGKKEGPKIYNTINKKRKESLKGCNTLPFYIKKYGEEEGTRRYTKWKSGMYWISKSGTTLASKESMFVFFPLMDWLLEEKICTLNEIHVGISGSREFALAKPEIEKFPFVYDFTIPKLNLIIEYNGETFHPNPEWKDIDLNKWNEWKHPYSKQSADIVYKENSNKIQYAKNNNFNILEIWSSTDPIINLAICKEFIEKLRM